MQDPLLFNRLGATLANSGKTELAIQYYLEALEIQPAYVRARFNLAVANMNLSVRPRLLSFGALSLMSFLLFSSNTRRRSSISSRRCRSRTPIRSSMVRPLFLPPSSHDR